MGVTILKQEYTNQFQPTSTTDWLLGNVGDIQKLSLDCAFAVKKLFTLDDSITPSGPNILILNSGANWKEEGFYVGLDFIFAYTAVVDSGGTLTNYLESFSLTVISILGNKMEVAIQGGGTFAGWGDIVGVVMPGTKNADTINKNVIVYADVIPQGIRLDYAQVENSQAPSGNIASFIDGSKTSLVMEDTNDVSLFFPLMAEKEFTHQLSFKSGLGLVKGTIEYISKTGVDYNYRINLYFMFCPFYEDVTNLIDNKAPSYVFGAKALTDLFQVTGFPVYNNPNITIKNTVKLNEQKGNTGWFDENFNQLPNPFTFTPVIYTNAAGTTVSQLDYANPITVTTTISGLAASVPITGFEMFQYGFVWVNINEDSEFDSSGNETVIGYKNNNYPNHENLKVSTGGQAGDLLDAFPFGSFPFATNRKGYSRDGASGMDVSHCSFLANLIDPTLVDVSITFVPSAGFTTFMESLSDNERQYVLWVSIGEQSANVNQGNRVSLKLDFNTMITYVEPIGPWDGLTIDFLDHPQDFTDTPVSCGNELFVEDDLLAKVGFAVSTTVDAATVPVPSAITFGVLAQRTSDDFQFVLDKNKADLTQYPNPTQYNFNESRGFKLGVGNTKNWYKVDYNGAGAGVENVLAWYGFKVRWEDWIKRLNVPIDFYDNLLNKNGYNNNWHDYFNTTGWNIYFYVNITTQLGTYQNLKSMSINDYDSNANVDTQFLYYKEDTTGAVPVRGALISAGTDPISGTPLGVIIEGENVWLEIIYTWVGPPLDKPADWATQIALDANTYATQCLEVDAGSGEKDFRQLSSVWSPEASNPMIPIPAETLTEIESTSTTVVTVKTRINSNKLINANRYKISGRIGCK